MRLIKIFFLVCIISSCGHLKTKDQNSSSANLEVKKTDSNGKVQAKKQNLEYVLGSDDVPLFAGLKYIANDSSIFDTMFGNIAISRYLGDFQEKTVKDFYLETLPQLGWSIFVNEKGSLILTRDYDKLDIGFAKVKGKLRVRFFISSVVQ